MFTKKKEANKSIKGFQIKGLKRFEGREWPGEQGSIYVDGKKVGLYNNDGSGSMVDIDFYHAGERKQEIEERLERTVKDYFAEHPNIEYSELTEDAECFFIALLDLMDDEKKYKKILKQGCPFVVFYKTETRSYEERIAAYQEKGRMEKFIQENSFPIYRIYCSLEDFDIK